MQQIILGHGLGRGVNLIGLDDRPRLAQKPERTGAEGGELFQIVQIRSPGVPHKSISRRHSDQNGAQPCESPQYPLVSLLHYAQLHPQILKQKYNLILYRLF